MTDLSKPGEGGMIASWMELILEKSESYAVPIALLVIGLLVFWLAPRLLGPVSDPERRKTQTKILRAVTAGFVMLQIVDLILHHTLHGSYSRILMRASGTLLVIYLNLIAFNLMDTLLQERFGKTKSIDGQTVSMATYHSRMASLILVIVVTFLAILAVIQIWGMGSLTERTGFIGVIAAFVILTNAVWFPDVYFGLTLLGSSMAEEGDTIRFPGDDAFFIVNRLTPFYTLLLNIDTNERSMQRNARMFENPIQNLTKRAAIDGVRQRLDLKVSYPENETDAAVRASLFSTIDKVVTAVSEGLPDQSDLHVNENAPIEWLLSEAGDYAMVFSVFYYLEPVPETKLTRKVRDHLRKTPACMTRLIYEECAARGLHLATPDLISLHTRAQKPVLPPARRSAGSAQSRAAGHTPD